MDAREERESDGAASGVGSDERALEAPEEFALELWRGAVGMTGMKVGGGLREDLPSVPHGAGFDSGQACNSAFQQLLGHARHRQLGRCQSGVRAMQIPLPLCVSSATFIGFPCSYIS